jgi:hypothetical protein
VGIETANRQRQKKKMVGLTAKYAKPASARNPRRDDFLEFSTSSCGILSENLVR